MTRSEICLIHSEIMQQEHLLLTQQTLAAAPLFKGAGYIAAGTEKSVAAGEKTIRTHIRELNENV